MLLYSFLIFYGNSGEGAIIMNSVMEKNKKIDENALNKDIAMFPQVHKITNDMKLTHAGVSRLVMLDRYAFKDTEKKTLKEGDFVVLTVKADPDFPARGTGFIKSIDWDNKQAEIKIDPEFISIIDNETEANTGVIKRGLDVIDKPLEVYYEQIAKRNATGLASVEKTEDEKNKWFNRFNQELASL